MFSHLLKFDTELTFLRGIFCKNVYPENFIDKCFKNFLNKTDLIVKNAKIFRNYVKHF